ncbi:C45 family autoproteolytic acyltransferase/hydolase [Amaricoccus macauensis]|uniref:C45 family autoproteolytic acyltransferase/hydolase n=1 Tax=Amaricoccus macauensis TaxID=57001 RepID=UPI003C7E3B3D
MKNSLTFDAIAEITPGPKWKARWDWSWPAYEAWFTSRGGDNGPSRAECEYALAEHMPELVPTYRRLVALAGGGDRAARFLSTWCPPAYLGGCSLAARSRSGRVRLVRNYDLSPNLNEGFLLRSEWCGRPVMGMIEFLWGLSDGVNGAGLSIALAYGGSKRVERGFGITTILRYVLETCDDLPAALEALRRIPSHMAYNLVLADRHGATASVEMIPGGGIRCMDLPIATNHQHGEDKPDRPAFTRTMERRAHLEDLMGNATAPEDLRWHFLRTPLLRKDYANGFGTLFTADYDPVHGALTLAWPGKSWTQSLDHFVEGTREITYSGITPDQPQATSGGWDWARMLLPGNPALEAWLDGAEEGAPDWAAFGQIMASAWQSTDWSDQGQWSNHGQPANNRDAA